MDAELEDKVKSCHECQVHQRAPAVAPLHPWEWPQRPWSRVHVDYAGPFLGKFFDAHSKWMEVEVVSAATSSITITKLRAIFATHGLPNMLVSDNGSVFTSEEFQDFTKQTRKPGKDSLKLMTKSLSEISLVEKLGCLDLLFRKEDHCRLSLTWRTVIV